jgi:hypothetical protein
MHELQGSDISHLCSIFKYLKVRFCCRFWGCKNFNDSRNPCRFFEWYEGGQPELGTVRGSSGSVRQQQQQMLLLLWQQRVCCQWVQ